VDILREYYRSITTNNVSSRKRRQKLPIASLTRISCRSSYILVKRRLHGRRKICLGRTRLTIHHFKGYYDPGRLRPISPVRLMYAKRIGESEETNASEASVVFALPGNDPLHGAEPSSFLLSLSSLSRALLALSRKKETARRTVEKVRAGERGGRKLFLCKVPRGLARGYEILMAHKM